MQVLLPAAACCSATGVLSKLQKAGFTVQARAPSPSQHTPRGSHGSFVSLQALEIETVGSREKIPGLPASSFATMEMEFIVTSPDADEAEVDRIVQGHHCSVVTNMGGVTSFSKSSTLRTS